MGICIRYARLIVVLQTLVMIGVLVLSACSSGSGEGRVALNVTWSSPPLEPLWLTVRVEERDEPLQKGRILSSTLPTRFVPGAALSLNMPTVPNGLRRHVVIEARTTKSDDGGVEYYGISKAFSVQAGHSVAVSVPVEMRQPEGNIHAPDIELLRDEARVVVASLDGLHNLVLHIRSTGTRSFRIANDEDFQSGEQVIDLQSDELLCTQQENQLLEDDCRFPWDALKGVPTNLEGEYQDGFYHVFLRLVDEYGYESRTYQVSALLDRTTPQVQSGALVPATVQPGAEFVLTVVFNEPLDQLADHGLQAVDCTPATVIFQPPLFPESGNVAVWKGYVETSAGMPEKAIGFEVRPVDQVGLSPPSHEPISDADGALVSLVIDDTPPLISKSTLDLSETVFGPDGNELYIAGHGIAIQATLKIVEESALAPGYPQVFLNSPAPLQFQQVVFDEQMGTYQFELVLNAEDPAHFKAQGTWAVLATVVDAGGNHLSDLPDSRDRTVTNYSLTKENPVTIDFTPPKASCTLLPEPSPAYSLVSSPRLQITPNEILSLSKAVTLFETWSNPVPGQFWSHESGEPGGTQYYLGSVVPGMGEQSLSFTLQLTDLAGNTTGPDDTACLIGESIVVPVDGVMPGLTAESLIAPDSTPDPSGTFRLGGGHQLNGILTVTNTAAVPSVYLSGHPADIIELMDFSAEEYVWAYTRTLNGQEVPGEVTLEAAITDESGNVTTISASFPDLLIDFQPPVADCLLNLPVAKGGDHIAIQATFSEPVLQPVLTLLPAALPFTLNPDKSVTDVAQPVYVYTAEVPLTGFPGLPETKWYYWISAPDLAGNELFPCSNEGLIDASPIIIEEHTVSIGYWSDSVPPLFVNTSPVARAGAQATIELSISELPAPDSDSHIVFGEEHVPMTCHPPGLCKSDYVFPEQENGGSDTLAIKAWMEDKGGNITVSSLVSLQMDYEAPSLAATPLFERCDGYADARVSQNDLWINSLSSCTYSVNDCNVSGVGGPVRITLATTENLSVEGCTLLLNDHELVIDTCSTGNLLTAYVPIAAITAQEGVFPVMAKLRDFAGNTSSPLEAGILRVDLTPPEQLDMLDFNAATYHRVPWGSQDTGGAPHYSITTSRGFAKPGSRLLSFDNNDPANCNLIGSARIGPDGSLGLSPDYPGMKLSPVDRDEVFVVLADPAGNRSGSSTDFPLGKAVPVRDGIWTATLGHKSSADSLANPHQLFAAPVFDHRHEMDTQNPVDEPSLLSATPGAITTDGGGIWRQRHLILTEPTALSYGSLVFDSVNEEYIMFGGNSDSGPSGETWSFRQGRWHQVLPSDDEQDGNPAPRFGHVLVTDEIRHRAVLFGGSNGAESLGDLWEWDGRSWRLAWHSEQSPGPSPRQHAGAAFHLAQGQVILFGGEDETGMVSETWAWNGNQWQKIATSIEPSPRVHHQMAWWHNGGGVLLHGGYTQSGAIGETWLWDGLDWQNKPDYETIASSGFSISAVPETGGVLVFGGIVDGKLSNSTRLLTTEWNMVETVPGATQPTPRAYHGMACSDDGTKCLVTGGETNLGKTNESWLLAQHSWQDVSVLAAQETGASSPGTRRRSSAVFEPARDEVLLFGGQTYGELPLTGTWTWDGRDWLQHDIPPGSSPEHRFDHAMAADPHRETIVVFGGTGTSGTLGDTWEWDGIKWSLRLATAPLQSDRPKPRSGTASCWDGINERVILFGGRENTVFNDTWEWNGTVWAQITTEASPPPRAQHAMVWDDARHEVILFGGYDYTTDTLLGDTWRWTGTNWEKASAAQECSPCPSARAGHGMVYAPELESVVLVGGADSGGYSDETWQWNGDAWSLAGRGGKHGPGVRHEHVVFIDPVLSMPVLFGGEDDTGLRKDQWEWQQGSFRPVQRATFNAGQLWTTTAPSPLSVSFRWDAQGTEYPGDNPQSGASLLVWSSGWWHSCAFAALDEASHTCVASGLCAPASAPNGLFAGTDWLLNIALTTLAIPGRIAGFITSSYLETTISYRAGKALRWQFGGTFGLQNWQVTGGLEATPLDNGGVALITGDTQGQLVAPVTNLDLSGYTHALARLQGSEDGFVVVSIETEPQLPWQPFLPLSDTGESVVSVEAGLGNLAQLATSVLKIKLLIPSETSLVLHSFGFSD